MSIDYKILFKTDIPKEFENSMGSYISTEEKNGEKYLFHYGDEEQNLHFSKVNWSKVNRPTFAFLDSEILKSEVAHLILRRAAGNVGCLNIDDLKDDLIEKSYTIKVLNDFSIGHISDVVLNFASEREVNSTQIRPYVLNLLNFMTMLAKSKIVSYPIDLDCGFSEDTFFIQAHCKNNEFVLENILDTLKEGSVGEISGQFEDILKYTDLLNVFTINSTEKLILTGCWFYENVWRNEKKKYSSLIVHDVASLKLDSLEVDNSVKSFINHSLDNLVNLKVSQSSLPEKYKVKKENEVVEAVNPAKVKNIFDYLKNKIELPVNKNFNVENLEELLKCYLNEEKKSQINSQEKKELVRLLIDGDAYTELDKDVERVKEKISKEDYISQMIKNVSSISAGDVRAIFDDKNDLKERISRIKGKREDLTEEINRVKGFKAHEDEHVQIIEGTKSDLGEGTLKVKSLENSSRNNDESPFSQNEISLDQKAIFDRVKASNSDNQEDAPETISEEVTRIKQDNVIDSDSDVWEVKRLNVINKMQSELADAKGLTAQQVNEKVEQIIESELGVENVKSKEFVQQFSNDIAEEWIERGVDNINNEIRQKLRLEKVEGQLANREKQVEKMKELITKLKVENGNLNVAVRDLNKENKAIDFKLRQSEDKSSVVEPPEEDKEEVSVSASKVIELRVENEKLHGQIEALKKRVNFMYENSKTNAATNINTNDIQAMADENERLKKASGSFRSELDKLKTQKREVEALLEKKNKEIVSKDELIAKYTAESKKSNTQKAESEIRSLNETVKELNQQNKESILKAKSFEQKLKFVNAQLDRYKLQERKGSSASSGANSASDLKMKAQIKKLESTQDKMKLILSKSQKELADKKTELHKAKLENKILSVRMRDLEKKLEVLGRKAS